MTRSKPPDSFAVLADKVTARLRSGGVKLTIGGEPSYVPIDPKGPEWSVTAIGPTKLRYSHAFAEALIREAMPGAVAILSPGKSYPGETNPRWAIHLLGNRDGSPLLPPEKKRSKPKKQPRPSLEALRRRILQALRLRGTWMKATDGLQPAAQVWVLPLDHNGTKWMTQKWPAAIARNLFLVNVEGSAGLRLPLGSLPPEAMRRALVLEAKEDRLYLFFPPLLQHPFLGLLATLTSALRDAGFQEWSFEGYIPEDEAGLWRKLGVTPDPGVIEINLPPCESAHQYAWWMERLEACAATAGLRSYKEFSAEEVLGTGGGNHLLFGGPTLQKNAFFTHPRWVTSILRYWQHHPSLSYLFTGSYVGASSQAPRPDESARELYDLEMAYQFLEKLEAGQDHRYLISETLRHLHIDRAGNTHRSEISFDKFWNAAWEGGCRGLIEFRAIESLPRADWMSAVALLWCALAALLYEKSFLQALLEHGPRLHDTYFLPTPLWEDFQKVLADLARAEFRVDREVMRAIWEYRFPQMLEFSRDAAALTVRKAMEGWPLLCETPLEGGNTSRFVDTSIERLEFTATHDFAETFRVYVQGRELPLGPFPGAPAGAGLRYRRSALHPSLHPGVLPQMPLFVTITDLRRKPVAAFRLDANRRRFEPCAGDEIALIKRPCQKLQSSLLTCDLRLP